jgi:hypothetical protein
VKEKFGLQGAGAFLACKVVVPATKRPTQHRKKTMEEPRTRRNNPIVDQARKKDELDDESGESDLDKAREKDELLDDEPGESDEEAAQLEDSDVGSEDDAELESHDEQPAAKRKKGKHRAKSPPRKAVERKSPKADAKAAAAKAAAAGDDILTSLRKVTNLESLIELCENGLLSLTSFAASIFQP